MQGLKESIYSIEWTVKGAVILDQTKLPTETVFLTVTNEKDMHHYIKTLTIRGAGALSIGGAYGVYLGVWQSKETDSKKFVEHVLAVCDYMDTARPTAVKLFVMVDKIRQCALQNAHLSVPQIKEAILKKCHAIRQDNIDDCAKVGEFALSLLKDGMTVLTHCNAGSYATVIRGSALAPFYLAKEREMNIKAFVDETRPLLQGSRLTAHELQKAGVDTTLICDNMAAYCMQQGLIDAVIVSSDRIAANGDTINKIGTYNVAVLAHYHKIPFYVASTFASVDFTMEKGLDVPIELRGEEEITEGFGKRTAPYGIKVYNPCFDVTPHHLITAIICEKGIARPNYQLSLAKMRDEEALDGNL